LVVAPFDHLQEAQAHVATLRLAVLADERQREDVIDAWGLVDRL
jgi:hypothetical protein